MIKRYLFWGALTALVAGLTLGGCSESTSNNEEEQTTSPLVGTWVMNNMQQSHTYFSAVDTTLIPGVLAYSAGDSITSGTADWNTFQALGVQATVVLNNDGTFSLTGNLPTANDTLGVAPTVATLTDAGTWQAAADLSTFVLNGSVYQLGGALTLDDNTNPTQLTLTYVGVDTLENSVLPVPVDSTTTMYFQIPMYDHFTSILGFQKQQQ